MTRIAALCTLAACAGHAQRPIYLGHAETGEVIVSTSHYQAMNGLAVASSDAGRADLSCSREVPTGTHVPHWICRYAEDRERDRSFTRETLLDAPKACGFNCTTRDGWAGAIPTARESVTH